jgi:hypothetical protein
MKCCWKGRETKDLKYVYTLLDVDSMTMSLVRDNTASEQLEIFN